MDLCPTKEIVSAADGGAASVKAVYGHMRMTVTHRMTAFEGASTRY